MATSKSKLLAASAVVASSLILSACSNKDTIPTATPTPTPSTAVVKQEDMFGLAFGNDFRAAANGEPVAVNDGDLIPVTLLTDPISITC